MIMNDRLKEAQAYCKKQGFGKCIYLGEYKGRGAYEFIPKDVEEGGKYGYPFIYLDDGRGEFKQVIKPELIREIMRAFTPEEDE